MSAIVLATVTDHPTSSVIVHTKKENSVSVSTHTPTHPHPTNTHPNIHAHTKTHTQAVERESTVWEKKKNKKHVAQSLLPEQTPVNHIRVKGVCV